MEATFENLFSCAFIIRAFGGRAARAVDVAQPIHDDKNTAQREEQTKAAPIDKAA
jgi:hypothetical protein